MNRFFTTLTVFAISLVAIGLGIRQSFETGPAADVLSLQVFAGVGLLATSGLLLRRRYRRRTNINRPNSGLAQPLRRLLSAVWS